MTSKEKTMVSELIETATKVPKDKREFMLGYLQCIVDMDYGKTKRRRNTKETVSDMG